MKLSFFLLEASAARQAGGKRREGPLWVSLGYVGNVLHRCPHILTCPQGRGSTHLRVILRQFSLQSRQFVEHAETYKPTKIARGR